jgi:sigma54-dependent transcription regulator
VDAALKPLRVILGQLRTRRESRSQRAEGDRLDVIREFFEIVRCLAHFHSSRQFSNDKVRSLRTMVFGSRSSNAQIDLELLLESVHLGLKLIEESPSDKSRSDNSDRDRLIG